MGRPYLNRQSDGLVATAIVCTDLSSDPRSAWLPTGRMSPSCVSSVDLLQVGGVLTAIDQQQGDLRRGPLKRPLPAFDPVAVAALVPALAIQVRSRYRLVPVRSSTEMRLRDASAVTD